MIHEHEDEPTTNVQRVRTEVERHTTDRMWIFGILTGINVTALIAYISGLAGGIG
jgi:hypothetical protein